MARTGFPSPNLGEVPYRGEVHRGEHEPILGRDLFEAVQAKRAANAVARQVRLRGAAAILTGRLFDDRGNRMGPTHANKLGVRVAGDFAESEGQSRQHRPRAGPRGRDPRVRSAVSSAAQSGEAATASSFRALGGTKQYLAGLPAITQRKAAGQGQQADPNPREQDDARRQAYDRYRR